LCCWPSHDLDRLGAPPARGCKGGGTAGPRPQVAAGRAPDTGGNEECEEGATQRILVEVIMGLRLLWGVLRLV